MSQLGETGFCMNVTSYSTGGALCGGAFSLFYTLIAVGGGPAKSGISARGITVKRLGGVGKPFTAICRRYVFGCAPGGRKNAQRPYIFDNPLAVRR